jgi:hypothetical protein
MSALTHGRDVLLGGYVPVEIRDKFAAAARASGQDASKLIRQFAYQIAGVVPENMTTTVSGPYEKLQLRLCPAAMKKLVEIAAQHGSNPSAWGAALLESELLMRPAADDRTLTLLRSLYRMLTEIKDVASGKIEDGLATAMAMIESAIPD